jgi:glycosyltransferase involved in cell wall biosynthesis
MEMKEQKNGPRILFITSHWPWAPAYGAQQRVLNVARILKRFGDLSLVLVPTDQEAEETVRRTRQEFDVRRVIRPVSAPRLSLASIPRRLRHEFDPTYLQTDPFVAREDDRAALVELVNQNDIVWVHTIRTANWFRLYRWPNSVLDADDIQSRTHQSVAQSSRSLGTRLVNLRRAWIWRRHESHFKYRFDAVTVCSEDDRGYFDMEERTFVVPNGSNRVPKRPRSYPEPARVGFIGNCDFMPNLEGLKWFIGEVWPGIKRQMPNVSLRLVGRGSDGSVTKLSPDIVGLGWLEDPGDEIATWSVMIVPIQVGGGTRVKIAEGFARQCPIVATGLGAFGYTVRNGEEILLADRADDFASSCLMVLKNPKLGEEISQRAHARFLKEWTWESCEGPVRKALQKCSTRGKVMQGLSIATESETNKVLTY